MQIRGFVNLDLIEHLSENSPVLIIDLISKFGVTVKNDIKELERQGMVEINEDIVTYTGKNISRKRL